MPLAVVQVNPSSIAVSRDGKRMLSTLISILPVGRPLKCTAKAASMAARPRRIVPSSLSYSPPSVQRAARALASPFSKAAVKSPPIGG